MLGKVLLTVIMFALPCTIAALALDRVDGWLASYVNRESKGLHRFEIRRVDKEIKIRAWSYGFPDDVDWGEVTADVYPEHNGIPHFVANFAPKNATCMLVVMPNSGGGEPHSGGLAICSLYTKYKDGRPPDCISTNFETPKKNEK